MPPIDSPADAAPASPAAPGPDAPIPNAPPTEPRPRSSAAAALLATIAVGAVLWATQELILPVLLAVFFALVGNPIIRALRRLYVPRVLGALVVLLGGLAIAGALGTQLVEPASEWVRQAPRAMREMTPKLRELTKPVQDANRAAENIARAAGGESKPVQVVRTETDDPYKMLTTTPKLIASVLAVVLLTFFFMVYGENLQKNAIALLPGRQQKKLTVEIMQSIELELSRYVLTITVINIAVGLIFAGLLHWLKVPLPEALLWGTMAALLNFAPYVGPLIGIGMMLIMGFVAFDDWKALVPAGIYLGLHTLEGQIVTPIVLGRSMRVSPLVLILALMVFGWLWGLIGLLLAVPLLVCVKLVLERIEGMDGWARLME
ncbi:AI-2E family transporter [Cognatilysobacter tabacisoli]|uniref:AI-2E family transporter n=1 Tax=Cognatilysobacter tabacisoli TaxID=2315424 RepID=UPI000E6AEDFE|nr:AI-2E family transporter [Lysobacter tabacisoli]